MFANLENQIFLAKQFSYLDGDYVDHHDARAALEFAYKRAVKCQSATAVVLADIEVNGN